MKNVLLLVNDCLRLDYWSRMARAQRATRDWFQFNYHWSVAHCSDPNFAALLSGQGPWQNGITTQMGSQYKAFTPDLLPLTLKLHGYNTWAVEPVKVPAFYHKFDKIAWHKTEDQADLELKAVRQFAKESGETPWFGMIRDMTCHYPYGASKALPERGKGGDIIPLYQEAVEHADKHIERLAEFVLSEHPNTIIIVCSDHGELLGEHGVWDHLYTLYSYLVRTPMVMYVPGLKGKPTNRTTQHTELRATILELLGLPNNGDSWAQWMRGEGGLADRTLMFQATGAGPLDGGNPQIDPGTGRGLWRHRATVGGKYKLIENIHAKGQCTLELYKADDYSEKHNLIRGHQETAQELYRLLPPVPDYPKFETPQPKDDDIILERLKALGYA